LDSREELGTRHGLDRFAHVRACRQLGVSKPARGDRADRRKQLVHIVPGETVQDPGPIPPRDDETRAPQRLEMGGRQTDRDGGPCPEDLDAALALGQQVEELDPVRVGECAADPGELLVQLVDRCAIRTDRVCSFRSHQGAPPGFGSSPRQLSAALLF
jgi:hypothetical protein